MKTAVNLAAMAGATKNRGDKGKPSINGRSMSPHKGMKPGSPDKGPRKKMDRLALLPINEDTLSNEFIITKSYPESVFTEEELDFLVKQFPDPESRIGALADCLNQNDWKKNLKANIIVSLYNGVLMFGSQNELSLLQIGTLASLFRFCLSCSGDLGRSAERTLEEFRSYILDLTSKSTFTVESFSTLASISDTDGRIPIFSPSISRQVIQFFSQTFFQHYKLYHLVFCQVQETLVIKEDRRVNEIPILSSMKDAITEEEAEELQLIERKNRLLAERESLLKEIADNPLLFLGPEEIKEITQETIKAVTAKFQKEFDLLSISQ